MRAHEGNHVASPLTRRLPDVGKLTVAAERK